MAERIANDIASVHTVLNRVNRDVRRFTEAYSIVSPVLERLAANRQERSHSLLAHFTDSLALDGYERDVDDFFSVLTSTLEPRHAPPPPLPGNLLKRQRTESAAAAAAVEDEEEDDGDERLTRLLDALSQLGRCDVANESIWRHLGGSMVRSPSLTCVIVLLLNALDRRRHDKLCVALSRFVRECHAMFDDDDGPPPPTLAMRSQLRSALLPSAIPALFGDQQSSDDE